MGEGSRIHWKGLGAFKDEKSSYGKIVHLKGFGSRIDFKDSATAAMLDSAVEFFIGLGADTLVWDGDSYTEDSFTYLIPFIYRRIELKLVMFLRDKPKDRKRVNKTWLPVGLPFFCYLCPADIKFDALGAIALTASGSKEVVSFGGGAVLKAEFERASKDIMFYVVPVIRRAQDGTLSEKSTLVEFAPAPNLQIACAPVDDKKNADSGLVALGG